MTGVVTPFSLVSRNGYFCNNNVDGGLTVNGVETFGLPLSFGETSALCPGGTINGGVRLTNNDSSGVEVDSYTVNGGLTIAGNSGFNEVEGTSVHGASSCQAGTVNDGSGGGPNSYTGPNHGCPA